ncbi:MOSC domain-containing protein [Luedemannella flava]|uniref:MOSC domain-containing protein n=1 Tax=Luedemannella flava TaxID=349316 RepID=A0ABP4YGC6_9ACTN
MQVTALTTYPVKGCYRVDRRRAHVYPWGLDGDRRWLIADRETGAAVTQREISALTVLRPTLAADGRLTITAPDRPDLVVPEPVDGPPQEVTVWSFTGAAARAGEAADAWLSEVLDRKVRLVWLDDPTRRTIKPPYAWPGDVVSFADGYPLLLANTASLAALNDWLAEDGSPEWPLPMERFRPNVVVTGAPAWAEDDWVGRLVRIGEVTFRVPEPCGRCVVTTTDQETGERGREPLRTLARHRSIGQKLLFAVNLIPEGAGEIGVGDPVTVR